MAISFAATLALPALSAEAAKPSAALVRHGSYIVHRVGMCADCHSPRDAHGAFIRGRWLEGARLDFAPSHPMPAWAPESVNLVALAKAWSQTDLVRFLRTGATPKAIPAARPPMPEYRMSAYDARAVAAYLRSLKH